MILKIIIILTCKAAHTKLNNMQSKFTLYGESQLV